MTTIPSVTFLNEAANYFENRPKNGEDGAHWSNVYNSENCRATAKMIEQMLAALKAMRAECMGFVPQCADQVDAAIAKAEGQPTA